MFLVCKCLGSVMVKRTRWKSRESKTIILHGAAVLPSRNLGVPINHELWMESIPLKLFLCPTTTRCRPLSDQAPSLLSFSKTMPLNMTYHPCHPGPSRRRLVRAMADRSITVNR